ncbi:MAG: hypothetical protein PVG03_10855 [Desulfarculaceae bacterium]|jgi:hypothetical protein
MKFWLGIVVLAVSIACWFFSYHHMARRNLTGLPAMIISFLAGCGVFFGFIFLSDLIGL